MRLLLVVAIDSRIQGDTQVLQGRRILHTEVGALHPVVVALIERVLVHVTERDVEAAHVRTAREANGVLLLRSPIVEHELAPVGIVEEFRI